MARGYSHGDIRPEIDAIYRRQRRARSQHGARADDGRDALVSPKQGEQYTSLRSLIENESGELVASGTSGLT